MQKIRNSTLSSEVNFDKDELFFSITKRDSTIINGNDTFVRISEFSRDELIGQYHNIVRHPDMPKVVFKVFWDYLKANRPIAAYVKNRTKNKGYYWVFAVVFPFKDSYISIRIKPNIDVFDSIKEIYSKLLEAQTKLDMDESQELFLKLLSDTGYSDYDHFINDVLVKELLKRKELLFKKQDKIDFCQNDELKLKIHSLYCSSEKLMRQYETWFEKTDRFMEIKSTFEEKAFVLSSLAKDIIFLSINASIASYKVDVYGETFGVLASDIRNNAKENDIIINNIDDLYRSLSTSLNEIVFLVSSISLQIETVTYFIKELFENNNKELSSNIFFLFELVSSYNEKLTELTMSMDKSIKKSLFHLSELEQQIMYLGYVQIYGNIESARFNDESSGFKEIFLQLKALSFEISKETSIMKNMGEEFLRDNDRLVKESKDKERILDKLKEEISGMEYIEG